MYVPYHPRTKRLYKMITDELGFPIVYKKTQTLGDILQKKGRNIDRQYRRNIVYSIPCQECPKKYVGQTTSTLKKRCNEHRNCCKKKFKKKILKTSKKNDGIDFISMRQGITYIFRQNRNHCRRKSLLEKAHN